MHKLSALLSLLLLSLLQGTALAQETPYPEPEVILQKADSAIKSLESITYTAEHFAIGLLSFGDQTYQRPSSHGEVHIKRVQADTAFGAHIAVTGLQIRTLPAYEDSPIKASYDGKRVRVLDKNKNVAYVNEPDQTGRGLISLKSMDLLWYSFHSGEGLENNLEADSMRFDGTGVVHSVPCYIIYTMSQEESVTFESWFFIGFDDYLPRKVITRTDGVPGQNRTEVVSLEITATNTRIAPETFAVHVPSDYEVKVYEGFNQASTPSLSEGSLAPGWELADAQGTIHSLQDLEGQLVIMDFWATWCGACIEAMPGLQELHEQYQDRGLTVLGINVWEGGDPVAFMQEKRFSYTSLLNADEVAEAYKVKSLPTLYVIDPDGKIIYGKVGSGPTNHENLLKIVKTHLPN